MVFRLTVQNVIDYLAAQNISDCQYDSLSSIEVKPGKNFNVVIRASNQKSLLVKQEPLDIDGKSKGDLLTEWRIQLLLNKHSKLDCLTPFLSHVIFYDSAHSVLVATYFDNYIDLEDFYQQQVLIAPAIASYLGTILARLHDVTLNYFPIWQELHPQEARLNTVCDDEQELAWVPDFSDGLEYLTPDAFGYLSDDGLKFFELCHRSEPLMAAIAQLKDCYEPCCLTHQDLKLNNVLLHTDWHRLIAQQQGEEASSISPLRIIDWEKAEWGDPAFDVGSLIASYLKLWLSSLVVSGIEIEAALRSATVPLEQIRPSLVALVRAYARQAPAVVERHPDFWRRVMQFAGYSLVRSLRVKIQQYELLGNVGLCTLQVATSLLCNPEQAIASVLGMTADALMADLNPPEPASNERISTLTTAPVEPAALLMTPPCALAEALDDLIQHLSIQPDGTVLYSQTPVLAVPAASHLPAHLQQAHRRLQTRNALYDQYFSGEKMRLLKNADANSTQRGVDVAFFEQLTAANRGQGYFEDGWSVVQEQTEGRLLQRHGLKLWVDAVETTQPKTSELGETLAVRMPPYRMDDGFYIAIGDRGLLCSTQPTVQIFFNLLPEGAIALMQHFTQTLNTAQIAFSFSVLYDPAEYGRRDSGILRIQSRDFLAVHPLLQQGYEQVRSHLRPAIPLFTKQLAPGVGLAEEPLDSPIEFGLHRCQLLADALLSAQSARSPEQRLTLIHQHFAQAGVHINRPYLNPNRCDRYAPLEEAQA